MDTIKSRTPEIYHSTKESLNDHQYVKFWNNNPESMDYKIKSYIVRDYCYIPEISVKQLFQNHCKKVGIFYDEECRDKLYKQDFARFVAEKLTGDTYCDIKDTTISDAFSNFVEKNKNEYVGDPDRYNVIMDMVDANASLYEIYNQFTNDELDSLGW